MSPDGRVVVSRDRRRLSATRVADGVRLRTVDACDEDPIEARPDWHAVRCGTRGHFRDPTDGRLVATLDHAGTLEIDGHLPTRERPGAEARRRARKLTRTPEVGGDGRDSWAEMLRHSFGKDGWECPECHDRLRLRAVVVGAASLTIVRSLTRERDSP